MKSRINQSLLRNFKTDIVLPPSLQKSPLPLSGFLHQSLTMIPPSLSWNFQQQIDVVSPWKQELAKQKKLRTITFILQAIEAGGTAYLLYEHIDRYGLK